MRISSIRRGRPALPPTPVPPPPAPAACGGTDDQGDRQTKRKGGLTKSVPSGVSITAVSCPGNVPLKKGNKFNSTVNLTVRGTAATGTYAGEIVNNNNDFSGRLINVLPTG